MTLRPDRPHPRHIDSGPYADCLQIIRRQSATEEDDRSKKSMQVLLEIMQAIEARDLNALTRNIERRRLSAD